MELIDRSPISYLGQPLNDNQQSILRLLVALLIPTIVAVALRVYARSMVKARLWWDDYTIILSLALCFAIFALGIISIKNGLGVSQAYAGIEAYLRLSLVLYLVYVCTVTTIKLSVLLMYYRLFKVQSFKRVVFAISGALLIWFIISFFLTLFKCKPISFSWDFQQQGTCLNQRALFVSTAASNSILDIVILCLPIKMIWGLQMSTPKRIQLTFTFLLGAFVCIVSIVRLAAVIRRPAIPTDPTVDQMGDVIWTTTEIYVGVISACLPTLRPLLTRERGIFRRFASKISSNQSASHGTPFSKRHLWPGSWFNLLTDESDDRGPGSSSRPANWSSPRAGQYRSPQNEFATSVQEVGARGESGYPLEGIIIERKMEASWSPRVLKD